MCDLLTTSTKAKIKGFKIVARKPNGKRYFSIAMGFKYPLDGHVPIVRKQRQIYSELFDPDIISKISSSYRSRMVGRTSIFLDFHGVQQKYQQWMKYNTEKGCKLAIIQAEISTDIMTGRYGIYRIAAGRHIRFIKEIQELN